MRSSPKPSRRRGATNDRPDVRRTALRAPFLAAIPVSAKTKPTAAPGSAVNSSLKFYPAQAVLDSADIKPKKLLIEIDPKAINPNITLHYAIADPSFRVKLDCDKKT